MISIMARNPVGKKTAFFRTHKSKTNTPRSSWQARARRSLVFLQHPFVQTIGAVLFWLCVWQVAAVCISSPLLLASPMEVLKILWHQLPQGAFWQAISFSALRIVSGFLLALFMGVSLAALAARLSFVKILLQPLMVAMKSIPVASFIILVLLWLRGTGLLAVCIGFLMALPLIYASTLGGIATADQQLLEMARVFRLSGARRVRYLYAPAVAAPLRAACGVAMGLCWKSGVAAEVIGIVSGSVGAALYEAKIFFSTGEVFAWTLVIVLVSLGLERLFLKVFSAVERRLLTQCKRFAFVAQTPRAHSASIALNNVTKRFGGQTIFKAYTASFVQGESVCIMSPSGYGKTTLLRLLMGLEAPDAGSVEGTEAVATACVFQESRLVPELCATDNVRLVCGAQAAAQLPRAFAAVGLQGEDLTKPCTQLSGGQQRRVALVRAMLAEADLLLLDEPFSGLDAQARQEAAAFVRAQKGSRTLLTVTHSESDAALLGARVLALDVGESEGRQTQ